MKIILNHEIHSILDHESFYHGRVFGEIDSHAQMHIDNGILTGIIAISDETFHIEV